MLISFFINLFILLVGWGSGILVNFLADKLPEHRRISRPICPICGLPQPLLNYLLFPRTCPACKHRRLKRTWWVEGISIICVFLLWYAPPQRLGFGISFLLFVYFLIIVVIDIEHHLILHTVSLAGVLIGFGVGIWLHGFKFTIFGGLAGFGIMLCLYFLGEAFARGFARIRDIAVEEEALGFGDVNLGGVIGLILGWPAIILGLTLAILIGGVVSLLYLIGMLATHRYRLFSAIPYGPFLITAAIFLLYFRDYF